MHDEIMIGERIAQLRERKGLSRAQLAEQMTVSVQAVGKWERGESLPDLITVKKLAELFDADINYFFENGDSKATANQDVKESQETRPKWNMSAANWRNGDFSGLKNLADKFKSSNVFSCKFCNSDLAGITFKWNNIKDCDFSGADLSGGTLSMSNLPNNNFSRCNFNKTLIKMCDIHGCNFSGTDFSNAEINGVTTNNINFKGAKWMGTRYKNSIFVEIVFDGDIKNSSFESCEFKKSQFKGVTFVNTFFKNCKMKKVSFTDCKADNITYSFLKHAGADISGIALWEE